MDFRNLKKAAEEYREYKKNGGSVLDADANFCDVAIKEGNVVEEYPNFVVAKNRFKYEIWDGYAVSDHLLVIPRRFTETISDFDGVERAEYFEIVSKYEKIGYNVYSRAPQSKRKTVRHQHTHLILPNHKRFVRRLYNVYGKILEWKS